MVELHLRKSNRMSKIVKTSISEARRNKGSLKSDWIREDRLSDEEIEKTIESDPDAAQALNEEWLKCCFKYST